MRWRADRELLALLRGRAFEAAAAWPVWDRVGQELLRALSELSAIEASASAADPWPAALMDDVTAEATKLAAYESARMDEMREWAARIEEREAALGEARSPLGRFVAADREGGGSAFVGQQTYSSASAR